MEKGYSPDPFPKPFNDFSAMGRKTPLLKNIREFKKENLRKNTPKKNVHNNIPLFSLITTKADRKISTLRGSRSKLKAEKRNSGLAKHIAVMISIQIFCFILTPLLCICCDLNTSHSKYRLFTAVLLLIFNGLIVLYYKFDKLNDQKQKIIFWAVTAVFSFFQFVFWVIIFWNKLS